MNRPLLALLTMLSLAGGCGGNYHVEDADDVPVEDQSDSSTGGTMVMGAVGILLGAVIIGGVVHALEPECEPYAFSTLYCSER